MTVTFHSCHLCDKVIADLAKLPPIMAPRRFSRYAVAAAHQLLIRHNCPGNNRPAATAPDIEENKEQVQQTAVVSTPVIY